MKRLFVAGSLSLILALSACSQNEGKQESPQSENKESAQKAGNIASNNFFESFDGNIDHIHGLGYAGNQDAVFFASHDGLKAYENGEWYKTKEENNDYMGFNATSSGFYTSGHPGPDSQLPNPLGIKSSSDNGQTIQDVTLEGETDFHVMAVGYENNAIYVQSPQKNSIMDANKFYFSEDQGEKWKQVSAKGIDGQVLGMATHLNDPSYVAVAAEGGVFLSDDGGEIFTLIGKGMQGTSVFFSEDALWYGGFNGNALLVKRSLQDGAEENIALPEMEQDAVMYLAQNPKDQKELTFVSFKGSVYQTQDGSKWELLVNEGQLE